MNVLMTRRRPVDNMANGWGFSPAGRSSALPDLLKPWEASPGQIGFFFLCLVSLVDVKVRRNKLRFRFLIVGAVVLLGWIYLIFF
jgi:hypothetical protein